MDLNGCLNGYYKESEDPIIDTSKLDLHTLFPAANDEIIKQNKYCQYDSIHRYLCAQVSTVFDALESKFYGGVYFLWDIKKESS